MTLKVSRSFRPSISGTVALFILASLFASLGMWQEKRAAEKEQTELQHRAASRVPFETALAGDERFARIDVSGHYDPVRHILLDNQVWKGRAGVHVFTPFYTLDGTAILVNRGWLPLAADRQTMPDIPTPQHETVLRGMLNTLPVPGRILGQADRMNQNQWPQLVTYLNLENIVESLDVSLENRVIQLSASEQAGFEGRDWKPVFLTSRKHKAYAFQWFALATISIVLWVFTGFRQPSGNKT
jgi:surfeit locus 1 family protein